MRDIKVGDSRECRPGGRNLSVPVLKAVGQKAIHGRKCLSRIDSCRRERPVIKFAENADYLIIKVEADRRVGARTRASAPPSNPIHITRK